MMIEKPLVVTNMNVDVGQVKRRTAFHGNYRTDSEFPEELLEHAEHLQVGNNVKYV